MINYEQLQSLTEICQHGSFSAAAKKLAITQSALSQKIKQLEEAVGQPLLVRTVPVAPTPVGERLIAHFNKVKLLEDSLRTEVPGFKEEAGFSRIQIAVNAESLSTWFIDSITPTLVNEKVLLEVLMEDQDDTADLLRLGTVLGCISSQKKAPSGCSSYFLGKMRYVLASSPAFADRYFPEGVTEGALRLAPAAIFGKHDKIHDDFLGQHFKAFKTESPPYHHMPSVGGLIELTRNSVCCALLPQITIQDALRRNELVNLMPKASYSLDLYWLVWSQQTPELQLITTTLLSKTKVLLK